MGSASIKQNGPPPQEVRAQVQRMTASDVFATSPQLAAFLLFVVEAVLRGHGERLKGYTIGVEVLRRDTSFDPQTDPIVRVEATRLRRAIERYYAGPGADDPVMIELPRGGYAPRISWRAELPSAPIAGAGVPARQRHADAARRAVRDRRNGGHARDRRRNLRKPDRRGLRAVRSDQRDGGGAAERASRAADGCALGRRLRRRRAAPTTGSTARSSIAATALSTSASSWSTSPTRPSSGRAPSSGCPMRRAAARPSATSFSSSRLRWCSPSA